MDRSYLRYLVAIAALTAAALFAAGERAAAREPDKVLSGSWNLESVDAPDTGIFTYCSTGIGYESRRVFYFIVDRFDRFSIGISDPAWNFEKGSHYPVTLFIDGRRIGEYELKGLTTDMVTIGLPNTIRIVEGFKDGRQITAKFMGTTLAFELIGSRTALADLERCVAQGLARDEGATAEGPADPRAPGLRQNAQAVAPAPTVRAPERVLSKSWGLRSKPSKIKGRSADCSVLALYETTRALAFFLNTHGRFALTIDSPNWNLADEMRQPATLSVDGRQIGEFEIVGNREGMYIIDLPYTNQIVEPFKHGERLDITVMESTLSYSLTGAGAGLDELERCIAEETQRAEDRRRNPYLPDQGPSTQAGAAPATGVADEVMSTGWELKANYVEKSGMFTHCRTMAEYQSSRSLFFILDRDDAFYLNVFNPKWRLEKDERHPTRLSVDDREIGEYEALVLDQMGIEMPLPYTDGVVEALKRGRQVAITFEGATLRFSLKGSRVALTELERCVAQGRQPAKGTRRNPFLTPPKSAAAPAEKQEPSAPVTASQTTVGEDGGDQVHADRRRFFNAGDDDDWAFVNRLLDEVGLWDYEYVAEGSVLFGDKVLYAWSDGAIEGGVLDLGLDNRTITEAALTTAKLFKAATCKRGFDYGIDDVRMDSGVLAQRLTGTCLTNRSGLAVAMLLFGNGGRGALVYHLGLLDDAARVKDADNRLFGWFQATF